jgi:hypothetical protein
MVERIEYQTAFPNRHTNLRIFSAFLNFYENKNISICGQCMWIGYKDLSTSSKFRTSIYINNDL